MPIDPQKLNRPTHPTQQTRSPQPQPSAQSSQIATAHTNAANHVQQQQALVGSLTQSGLANVAHHIERVSEQRSNVIEQTSETLAYLHSPQILEAEIWTATMDKMQAIEQGNEVATPFGNFQMALPQKAKRFLTGGVGSIAESTGHAR